MTLEELIERLTELQDELGPETEVRLATQENWPFENSILGVTTNEEFKQIVDEDDDGDGLGDDNDEPPVVYIVEGNQLGYFSQLAWRACRGG